MSGIQMEKGRNEREREKITPPQKKKRICSFLAHSHLCLMFAHTHIHIYTPDTHSLFVLHPSNSFKCLAFIIWYESNSDDNREVWQKCHAIVLILHVFIVMCMRWTLHWTWKRKREKKTEKPIKRWPKKSHEFSYIQQSMSSIILDWL